MRGFRLPFRLLGVPLRLDASFLIILPLLAWLISSQIAGYASLLEGAGIRLNVAALTGGATPILLGLASAVGLFVGVVLHELGHVVVARLYGVRAEEITLWFLGGVAQFRELPRGRGAEAVVAVAGPVASLALAVGSGALIGLFEAPFARFLFSYLAIANGGLGLFNLLPALPLDGGRILRSLVELGTSRLAATRVAVLVSRVVAIGLGVWGFLSFNILLMAVAFFVYQAGGAEARMALLEDALAGRTVRDLMTPDPATVPPDMPLRQFARLRSFRAHTGYPVVDAGGRLHGFALVRDAGAEDEDTPAPEDDGVVADIAHEADTVAPGTPLTDVMARLGAGRLGRLTVVDRAGAVVGILSKTDVLRELETLGGGSGTTAASPRDARGGDEG